LLPLFGALVLVSLDRTLPMGAETPAVAASASLRLESQGGSDSSAGRWRTLGGEPRDSAAADALVARLRVEHHLGAISVAVVQDGRLVFYTVRGEVRSGRPADTNTVFRGASLGKPVFAYLVLRLVDEGILDLDSPIETFLPRPLAAYEHYSGLAADPRHSELTVRHLLSQQSGLPNWHRGGPVPLLAEPGTRFGYSGEGYSLLQLVVEERTGRAVNDLAREKVFEPLGMTHSSFLWENRFDEHFAVDLGAGLGPLIRESRRRASVAGSLITNAADYARFLQAVMEGRGLSGAMHTQMLERQVDISSRSIFSPPGTDSGVARAMRLSWTLGWGRFVSERGAALFHVGREEGCEGYAVAFLESRTALVVMSVSPLRGTFAAPLAAALIGDTYSPLDWLEYWRTAEVRPSTRLAIPGLVAVLAGVTVVVAIRLRRARRRAATGLERRPE
jgi:CubicO group peptidase (beta-lactamase class C family)